MPAKWFNINDLNQVCDCSFGKEWNMFFLDEKNKYIVRKYYNALEFRNKYQYLEVDQNVIDEILEIMRKYPYNDASITCLCLDKWWELATDKYYRNIVYYKSCRMSYKDK